MFNRYGTEEAEEGEETGEGVCGEEEEEREREEKRDEKEIGTEERLGGGRSKNEAGPPRGPRTHGCDTTENEREREVEEREEGGARERTVAESILPPPPHSLLRCEVS